MEISVENLYLDIRALRVKERFDCSLISCAIFLCGRRR